MPRGYEIYYLFQSLKTSTDDLTAWLKSLIGQRSNSHARKKLKEVCHLIIKEVRDRRDVPRCGYRTTGTSVTDALLGMVVQASVHLKNSVLCRHALGLVQDKLPHEAIVKAFQHFELPAFQQGYVILRNHTFSSSPA